jgi:hypothetical protein
MISTSTFSLISLVLAGLIKCQINGIDIRDIYEEMEHILVDVRVSLREDTAELILPTSRSTHLNRGLMPTPHSPSSLPFCFSLKHTLDLHAFYSRT